MTDSSDPNQPTDPTASGSGEEVEGYGLFDLGGSLNPSPPPIVPDATKAKDRVHVSDIQVSKHTDS